MRTLAINSAAVTVVNASVHIANYVVFAGIAALFGATWQTDAFFLAFSIPVFFVGAVVGAVGSVFIPIFAECKLNRPQILGHLVGSAFLYVLLGTILIVLILFVALYIFQRNIFVGAAADFQQLVVQQTFLLLPVIVIQTLTGVISAFYNAQGRFLYPPATDAVSTLAVVAFILVFKASMGIFSLPLGFVSGAIVHLCLLIAFWRKFDVRIVWTWKVEPELRRSLNLSLPLILGTAVLQFGTVITRFIAAQLPEGSVTILDYASRIAYGIMELLTSGFLLVILAEWSRTSAKNDTTWLNEQVKKFALMISFVVIPIVAIALILRYSIVAIAFQRGSFDPAMTTATASVLTFFLIGIPIDAVSRIYVRLFLVWQNTWIIGSLAAIRVLITAVAALGLVQWLGLEGIALADTLALTLIGLALIRLANHKLGNTFLGSGGSFLEIITSALCAAGGSALVLQLLAGKEIIGFLVAGVIGGIIYIAVSWLMRNQQLSLLIELIKPRSSKGVIS